MLSPTNQSFSLKAGETTDGSIKVINPGTSSTNLHYKIQVLPYSVDGENYELDLSVETDRTAISKWTQFANPEGMLAPGQSIDVPFSIVVPETAPPGGQYAVIIVSSSPEANGVTEGTTGVERIFEVASVLYATVDGQVIRGGQIVSNNIPFFSTEPKLFTEAVLENTGNVHALARIVLSVKNYFNGETIYAIGGQETDLANVIMPDTTRSLKTEVGNLPSPGVLNVEQTVEYLGNTSTIQKTVFICPVWLILVLTLVFCSILTAIILRVRRRLKKRATDF